MPGKNTIMKTFTGNSNWTCPAGVTRVRVITKTFVEYLHGATHFNVASTGATKHYIDNNFLVWGMGLNVQGQIGDGTIVPKSSPVQVLGSITKRFKELSDGESHCVFLTEDGAAYTTGINSSGQLGDGSTVDKSSPVLVASFAAIKRVAAGRFQTYFLSGSKAWAVGGNTAGALGDNTIANKSSPVAVTGNLDYRFIAGGNNSAFAIGANNGLGYGWGNNNDGQLGDGTVVSKSSPVVISGSLKFKKISAGGRHVLGLTETGALYAWGDNTSGMIGNGTNLNKYSSPVLVSGGLTAIDIAAGDDVSFAVASSGQLYSWGVNKNGQLGQNNNSASFAVSSPTLVSGGSTYIKVGSHYQTSYGIRQEGWVSSWGSGDNGALGNNAILAQSVPVLVSSSPRTFQIGQLQTITYDNVFEVIPGTVYPVTFSGFTFGYFGINPLCIFPDEITLIYDA